MRRESTAIAVPDGKCSACGGKAFADLASVDTALAVREYERREIALRGGIVIHLLGTIAGIAAGAGAIAATMAGPFEGLLAVSVVFMAGGFAMYTGRRVWAGLTTPVRLASRWRAPLRAWRLGEPIGRGVATGDRALRAPISGRTVIAWRVEVRYPGDRDDACALLEQECAQIAIAGVPMDAEPIIATKATTLEAEGEEAREYLLSRGIDPHDILEICERVVVEGAAVEVHAERARPLAVLVDAAVA